MKTTKITFEILIANNGNNETSIHAALNKKTARVTGIPNTNKIKGLSLRFDI
jgi:hypothetical protein